MKYKNLLHKKSKNTHALRVICGSCKTPLLMYEKGGNGNLIKIQAHRIIESEFDLESHEGRLECLKCKEVLANRGVYRDRLTYFIVRGMIHSKRMNNYSY